MDINSCCEIYNDIDFFYNTDEIEKISSLFLKYIIDKNQADSFSCDYNYSIDICICDNDFIHNINREYRDKDMPTDVITFALYNDSESKLIVNNTISLGQIVISADKVYSQAAENNVQPKYEFLNLLAHGILHLLGFDHPDDNSLNNMLELQRTMIEEYSNVKI